MSVETCYSPTSCETLDFRPELAKNHFENLQNSGFTSKEARNIITGIFERDLKYLFLERFSRERLVHYQYSVSAGDLLSPNYEALGDVGKRLEAAIEERKSKGFSANREEAELEGFNEISNEVKSSVKPIVFLLVSPPPLESELCQHPGYADYSFYFFGKFDPKTNQVDMFAWRNEKSLYMQREEVNRLFGGKYLPVNVHPNDFLRRPIFRKGDSFDELRKIIADMPADSEIEDAKSADFSKYSEGVKSLAEMLSALIVNNASIKSFRRAQLKVEMEFVKWVSGGQVKRVNIDESYFSFANHGQFTQKITENFAYFAAAYKEQISQFACGGCGGSVMSMYSSRSIYIPGLMEISMPDFFANNYIACPGCGESVRLGSQVCKSCGLTKSEHDAKSTGS